jgi:hypothetical protein
VQLLLAKCSYLIELVISVQISVIYTYRHVHIYMYIYCLNFCIISLQVFAGFFSYKRTNVNAVCKINTNTKAYVYSCL